MLGCVLLLSWVKWPELSCKLICPIAVHSIICYLTVEGYYPPTFFFWGGTTHQLCLIFQRVATLLLHSKATLSLSLSFFFEKLPFSEHQTIVRFVTSPAHQKDYPSRWARPTTTFLWAVRTLGLFLRCKIERPNLLLGWFSCVGRQAGMVEGTDKQKCHCSNGLVQILFSTVH